MSFSGSYSPEDVTLLLQIMAIGPTPVAEKERLIQTGARHYSEVLAPEAPPTPDYLSIYRQALADNGPRVAQSVVQLAKGLAEQIDGPITLISLVRAGLPVGVLLARALRRLGKECHHYGISIIRDRGLDARAMAHILNCHAAETVVFVDGWTGKGAISRELSTAAPACGIANPRLATLGDIGGFAWMAPTSDDWLIPSGILGGVVSGLVSRTVLNDAVRDSGGFHASAPLPHLAKFDVSRAFVDHIWGQMPWEAPACQPTQAVEIARRQAVTRKTIDRLARENDIINPNRIKPSLAEATRAVLRRQPHKVYLAAWDDAPDLAAIRHLIERGGLRYEVSLDLLGGYRAVTIIQKTS